MKVGQISTGTSTKVFMHMSGTSDGWSDAPPPNDFTRRFGPIQRKRRGDRWQYAMRVDTGHRNGAGLMHGGAMTAFIDECVGTIVAEETGTPNVTVHFSMNFLRPARVDDFLELSCEIVKATRSMTFVDARLIVAGDIVATANLIFKVVRATKN